MKITNTLVATVAVAFLSTGCVKPVQDTQQVVYDNTQPVYEESSPIIYDNTGTSNSGVIYSETPTPNNTVTTTYPQVPAQEVYTNPYEPGAATAYPDPYANGSVVTTTTYPTTTQYPATTAYPAAGTQYPATTTPTAGGIHLQVAALKDHYAAEEFKNRLVLAPGQSAYVQRGPMNKIIITGISSMLEATQLKDTRYPGAFIVQGAGGGYTPPVSNVSTPVYDNTTYTVNDPYGMSSSSTASSSNGIGVQVGAFSSKAKAQEVADSRSGQYRAIVKRIGQYYKVILTGFPSRAAAKAHASQIGGFVVSTY